MKNQHEVGSFKTRLTMLLLSLVSITVMAGESVAATNCSTCHGMPPLDSPSGVRTPSTGAVKGSHQKHVSGGAVAADCVVCHSAASASYGTNHSALSKNKISMTAGIYSKGTFINQTSIPNLTNATCSNNCHANVYSSAFKPSPNWGSAGTGCTTCHDVAIGSTGPATGSHAIHNKTDCTLCHAAGTSSTTQPSTGHMDGTITVTNGYPVTAKHAAGTYSGTCSSASCHVDVYGAGSATTPVWGSTGNGCATCHSAYPIGVNGPATGSHAAHAGKACDTCHAAGTTATSAPSTGNGHIDGNVDVYYFNYPANVVKHAPGSGYGSCSTAYCHSNGRGTYASPTWGSTSTGCTFCHPNLSAGHDIHVNTLLSEVSFYGYTSTKSVGTTYKFGCANCHPVSLSNHLNNSVDVDLTASAAGGHLKANNGVSAAIDVNNKCSDVYCHSNGYKPGASFTYNQTPAWGGAFTGDRCASCHGNSPNTGGKVGSSAHSVHTVGIHYTDIFNGVSKKLPQSGGAAVNAAHGRNNRSTTINCNICHALTVSSFANDKNIICVGCHTAGVAGLQGDATIADKSKHVNGTVDVSFINQKIATKAQVAKGAFASYTASNAGWSRNNNLYKTYTSAYDVTKSNLSAAASYSQANGCLNVACHSGITVKWTDALTCTSCHTRLK